MSYEKRRSSRKIKRILYYLFLGLIVSFVIFIILRFFFDISDEAVLPRSVVYYNKVETVGFPLLEQKIYSIGGLEASEIYHKEGERVSAGSKLAFLSQYGSGDENLLFELQRINRRLAGQEGFNSESYFSEIGEMQRTIGTGHLANLGQRELQLSKEETSFFFTDNRRKDESPERIDEKKLLERKQEIEADLKTVQKAIYSEFGGIVSYFITIADESFFAKSVSEIDFSDFEKIEQSLMKGEVQKKKGLRLIDNFSASVVLKIEDSVKISNLSLGDRIRLFHEKIGEVDAIVEKIVDRSGKALLFLKVNKELHKLYSVGFTKFTVILEKRESYQLPLQALISDERGDGVYINYKSGIVKYRPVSVLAKDEDFIYVSRGNRNGKILSDLTGEMQYTIGKFDPVYIHPNKLSEDVIAQ